MQIKLFSGRLSEEILGHNVNRIIMGSQWETLAPVLGEYSLDTSMKKIFQ